MAEKSEIRDSQIRDLLEKVRKRNYGSYLRSTFLKKIRHFDGATINFDFPVTALVGPNGSGKSTVLAAAACAYSTATPKDFFFTSVVGDQQDFVWEMEYELIDRQVSPTEATRVYVKMTREGVELSSKASRPVKAFGIHRTLPAVTSPTFMRKYLGGTKWASTAKQKEIETEFVRREASRVLGKELSAFKLYDVEFTVMKVRKLKNK
jgi:signal recognition particle GTPase